MKYILVAVLVLIFLPLWLYLILITPSRIGIVDRSDVGAWIGFYGAVLGGAITLLGVWLTIKNQEKESRQEKAIQFKPILNLIDIQFPENLIGYREVGLGVTGYSNHTGSTGESHSPRYFLINQSNKISFYLTIKNDGRGETSNAYLKTFEPVYTSINWADKHHLHPISTNQYVGELLSGQKLGIKINLPPYLLVKKEVFFEQEELELNTILEIQYNDMFDERSYQYDVHVRFRATMFKTDYEEATEELMAVRVDYILDQIMPNRKLITKEKQKLN